MHSGAVDSSQGQYNPMVMSNNEHSTLQANQFHQTKNYNDPNSSTQFFNPPQQMTSTFARRPII
jgi:hypothetical protein